jgi:hypothetical protein
MLTACFGIHYKIQHHQVISETLSNIPLVELKQKTNDVRGHIYAPESVITGNKDYFNFHPMNLKKMELGMKTELTELDFIYDILADAIDPEVLHMGWTVYVDHNKEKLNSSSDNNVSSSNIGDEANQGGDNRGETI